MSAYDLPSFLTIGGRDYSIRYQWRPIIDILIAMNDPDLSEDSIKDVFYISLQLPASMNQLTWSGANNIEKVLQTAITRAHNTMQAFRYSGEIFAGEE